MKNYNTEVEKVLKELEKHHFIIYSYYEVPTNSIVIRLKKRIRSQWYGIDQRVTLDEIIHSNTFDFNMAWILKNMAKTLEQDIVKKEESICKQMRKPDYVK